MSPLCILYLCASLCILYLCVIRIYAALWKGQHSYTLPRFLYPSPPSFPIFLPCPLPLSSGLFFLPPFIHFVSSLLPSSFLSLLYSPPPPCAKDFEKFLRKFSKNFLKLRQILWRFRETFGENFSGHYYFPATPRWMMTGWHQTSETSHGSDASLPRIF